MSQEGFLRKEEGKYKQKNAWVPPAGRGWGAFMDGGGVRSREKSAGEGVPPRDKWSRKQKFKRHEHRKYGKIQKNPNEFKQKLNKNISNMQTDETREATRPTTDKICLKNITTQLKIVFRT